MIRTLDTAKYILSELGDINFPVSVISRIHEYGGCFEGNKGLPGMPKSYVYLSIYIYIYIYIRCRLRRNIQVLYWEKRLMRRAGIKMNLKRRRRKY